MYDSRVCKDILLYHISIIFTDSDILLKDSSDKDCSYLHEKNILFSFFLF